MNEKQEEKIIKETFSKAPKSLIDSVISLVSSSKWTLESVANEITTSNGHKKSAYLHFVKPDSDAYAILCAYKETNEVGTAVETTKNSDITIEAHITKFEMQTFMDIIEWMDSLV